MTNEEAIRLVDDRMCYGRGKWSKHHQPVIDEYWQAGEMAIKALEAEPHWIPVTERLPEDGQEVLITVEKKVEVFDGYSERRTVWHAMMHDEEEKHFCIWGDEQHLFSEVIAWMPLPEPYKGVTDGDD